MAGAKPGVHALQLKPPCVHEALKKGGKFVKWDEPSLEPKPKDPNSVPTLVTLKVDPDGFFLTWSGGNNMDAEILDMSSIRDTRTGKYAKQPKDAKQRDVLGFGRDDSAEGKLLSIVYGNDLVNISFLNLQAMNEDEAKLWTDELFLLATNILSQNASRNTFLRKAYVKLKLQGTADGKISMKNILKLFSDKRRVETALEQCGLSSPAANNRQAEGVKLDDFTWEAFQKFLDSLCLRPEIQSIFDESGSKRKPFITLDQFMDFINRRQRDSRLNEVLYPPLKREHVRQIMEKYEKNISQLDRDQISLQAFSRYLEGEENGIVPPERLDVIDDMNQPLSHYFINSSHNTYLTVGQLTGLSSVEMYRQVLLTGCRCVELDCWKGRTQDDEPYITHGFTMTTEISFKEVIEAIAESAFKASPYPVILSFENHVDSARQQAKMAEYCRTIFGDALLIDPLDKYPLLPGQPLPSPQDLLGKILVKNKKNHHRPRPSSGGSIRRREGEQAPANNDNDGNQILSNGEEKLAEKMIKEAEPRKSLGGEGESEEEEEEEEGLDPKKNTDEGTAGSEVKATEEMSTLVNYIEPVKFKNFEMAAKKQKFFEMSSFVETKGLDLLKNAPSEFVEYNKNQLSRIYPKGTRVDSSNYMPQLFWNAGCQMVALNFQTLDLPMQLNMGVFEYNGKSGYLLKPEFMRRTDKHFDPFTENIVDGIVANTIKVKVLSGQFLSDKKVGVYVEVDMLGIPADTKRKYRTRTSNGNSLDPVWEDESFVFNKVVLPTLASLRIAVFEENGKFIGHRILPVSAVRPGYHYINLKTELNQPLLLPSLLVYTEAQDYIPNQHQEYAEALTNPIKHISELDKRNTQLAVLMEDGSEYVTRKPKKEETKKESDGVPGGRLPAPFNPLPPSSMDEVPDGPKVPVPVTPQKEELVSSVMEDVCVVSMEELMEQKNYIKLIKKHEKDVKELRKKHLKKVWALSKEQKNRSSQLQCDTQRRRSQIEKNLKRSIKKNESQDPVRRELTALDQELEKQAVELREWQMKELLKLRQELFSQERAMKMENQMEAFEMLKETASKCHTLQLKKLQEMCEKEKKDLQKILNRKRQNSISEAKNHSKEKAEKELEDINRKHIQESVASIRSLELAQLKRQEKVVLDHKNVMQRFEDQLPELKSQLVKDLDEEYKRLPEEICQHLKMELQNKGLQKDALFSQLSNHSSPSTGSDPPSNCSSPSDPSSPNRSTFYRSTDNTPSFLADSEAELSIS